MIQSPVITVRHLTKRYGDDVAVNDISFEVRKGEIFGIVGPNGAGQTSAVEAIMGLRVPFEGEVRVLGMDPQRQRTQVAERIGIQLQEAQLPFRLKVWEILDLFSSFFHKTVVLVTHFMEEAQTLCDRVAIIDDGRIVALDTPNKLLTQIDGQNGVLFEDQPQLDVAQLRALPAVDRVEQANGVVRAFGSADNLVSSVVIALEHQ